MTSLAIFCAAIVLLCISATQATPFYQTVDGNLDNIPKVESLNFEKLTAGEWYFQYTSLEGVTCGSGHGVGRGSALHIDLLMFDSTNKNYINVREDFTYDEKTPGVFTSDIATKHIVATDEDNWLYCVQTTKNEGKSEVLIIFATREHGLSKEAEDAYQKYSADLAAENLLPKTMLKQSQENCPPITKVVTMGVAK